MKLYLADASEDDLDFEATFSADSIETAELICEKRNWLLIGELIEEHMVTDVAVAACNNRIH